MLNEFQKARLSGNALRQLRGELLHEKQNNQANAITEYLLDASNESLARLYDIFRKYK